jgi:hypothetical protein
MLRAEYGINQFLSARLASSRNPERESSAHLGELFERLYGTDNGAKADLRRFAFRFTPLFAYDFARRTLRTYRAFKWGEWS